MSTPETITSEIQKLSPSALVELFELDLTPLGESILRFHAGTNELIGNVVWDGNTYTRYPVEASGFDFAVNSQLPRPKLKVSNAFGSITAFLLAYQDIQGMVVTRRRTMVKYLDAVNFTGSINPTADNTAEFAQDIFVIDRKVTENKELVEFELTAAIDVQGVKLPRRQIVQNICPWLYRGTECGYTGTNYFDSNDSSVVSSSSDVCGKRLSSCQKRFGTYGSLPFGGFPSCANIR